MLGRVRSLDERPFEGGDVVLMLPSPFNPVCQLDGCFQRHLLVGRHLPPDNEAGSPLRRQNYSGRNEKPTLDPSLNVPLDPKAILSQVQRRRDLVGPKQVADRAVVRLPVLFVNAAPSGWGGDQARLWVSSP